MNKAKDEEERKENLRKEHRVTIDIDKMTATEVERDEFGNFVEPNFSSFEAGPTVESTQIKWETTASLKALSEKNGGNRFEANQFARQGDKHESKYFLNDTLVGRARRVYEGLRTVAALEARGSALSLAERLSNGDKPANMPLTKSTKIQHEADFEVVDEAVLVENVQPATSFSFPADLNSSIGGPAKDDDGPITCRPFASNGDVSPGSSVPGSEPAPTTGSQWGHESDKGMCLSMHQPWASLLVLGIKRVEGRGWPTDFRGRLWIASTAQVPSTEDVKELESYYLDAYGSRDLPFPKTYPPSALLGCVDLTDCWPLAKYETYRLKNSLLRLESSSSAFQFIVANPRVLGVPVRVSGQHKLWKLSVPVYSAAQQSLKPALLAWRAKLVGEAFGQKEQRGLAGPGSLDLWPPSYSGTGISASAAQLSAVQPAPYHPRPGFVLLRHFFSLAEQQAILDICRSYGRALGGFYVPTYENEQRINLQMFCFGLHWNPRTCEYERTRTNHDHSPAAPLDPRLLAYVARVRKAVAEIDLAAGCDPEYQPDICIVNYYQPQSGRLGVHQDKDEQKESLLAGKPVVAISLGDAGDFVYGEAHADAILASQDSRSLAHSKGGKVRFSSGDAMVFGGPSRMLFHGITKIHPNTSPRGLNMREGRVSLTFRSSGFVV